MTVTCFRLIAILLRYEVLYLPTESLFLNELAITSMCLSLIVIEVPELLCVSCL